MVTATREPELLKETPASIGILRPETIQWIGPAHPQQILGQIPGVAISVTNGEGHTTSIRQPFTTSPLYLFLEDGIPVRPTGFFNHNALYEVNLPMAGGIEVTRGLGSALYGSDAIGGIINVLTQSSGPKPKLSLSSEGGSFGWWRELASLSSGSTPLGEFHADLNLTHTDGWRRATAYDRQSANVRWDWTLNPDTRLKTIVGYTHIDQQTGANTPLPWDLYQNAPRTNLFAPAYRQVSAFRLSSELERRFGEGALTLTPYFRDNRMNLNGSFNLSSDPRIEKTESQSYGLLAKWRQDFPDFFRAKLILGLDLERSPGQRTEDALSLTRTDIRTGAAATSATGAYTQYTGTTLGNRIYDYGVTFWGASPYLHGEISPLEKLRLTAGARYDTLGYDLKNRILTPVSTQGGMSFGQARSDSLTFQRLNPKVGLTYELTRHHSLYGSYNQGFRIPAESQLFRGGGNANAAIAASRAANALRLQPIKAHQFEIGARGQLLGFDYTLALYELRKRDDLVSTRFLDPALGQNVSVNQNAGKTQSRGIEISLGRDLLKGLNLESSLSFARHQYLDWKGLNSSNGAPFDFSGNDMAAAPRFVSNTRLSWSPIEALSTQLEWVRIGSYYLQESNAPSTNGVNAGVSKYAGHHLFNFRSAYELCRHARLFLRVLNLADSRYADSAQISSNTAVYSPGLPRTFYGGLELLW